MDGVLHPAALGSVVAVHSERVMDGVPHRAVRPEYLTDRLPHPAAPPGWTPASPCTPGCLPTGDHPRAGRVRVAARLAGLAVVLLAAVAAAPLLPARWPRACSRAALRAAGVELRVTGGGPLAGALVVANHVSWIDVLALQAVAPVRMLAKREVRSWPLLGGLAERTGAVFVDRSGLRALPATVAATAAALRAADTVGVFPEGTTWCGGAAGPFRRAAFQAAIDAGAPVRPVAVVFRLAGVPRLRCEVTVLPAVDGIDRRELAAVAGAAIGAVTGMAHPARTPRTLARRPAAA
jgi:1-acyl-sn-glycerol-3-phosphate acyltransferase